MIQKKASNQNTKMQPISNTYDNQRNNSKSFMCMQIKKFSKRPTFF